MKEPYFADLKDAAKENDDYRRVVFTGTHSQLVLMSLQPGEEIGLEVHAGVDQILYAVDGEGTAVVAGRKHQFHKGSAVCVPAGVEHNIVNDGDEPLKLFTVYSPPGHPSNTVESVKPAEEPVRA